MSEEVRGDLYAMPMEITDIADCAFYHVMDVPGHGTVGGQWDLRGHESEYLGFTEFAGKRVLEIGPASGCLTFFMEKAGADVVAFDLSPDYEQDLVPYAKSDWHARAVRQREYYRTINNSWWFLHRAFGSNAKLAHGTVYQIPRDLGKFEIATFSAVLLHFRDPLLALQRALDLTTETVIVTDVAGAGAKRWRRLLRRFTGAHLTFLPNAATGEPPDGFWSFNPEITQRMLAVLGFEHSVVTYHSQRYVIDRRDVVNFTVVAHRVSPSPR